MHSTFIADPATAGPSTSRAVRWGNRVLQLLRRRERLTPPPGPLASSEARLNFFHLAAQTIVHGVPGDFVEIGCNSGDSSLLFQRVLQQLAPHRKLHLYDSFQGVPAGNEMDEGSYTKGEMRTEEGALRGRFAAAGLPLPPIHAGWFEDTLPATLPAQIAFAMIDADLYASTLTALQHVYPRLSSRAACVFGVYCDPSEFDPPNRSLKFRSPGVKKACDEFLRDKPEKVSVLYAGHYTCGYFQKLPAS